MRSDGALWEHAPGPPFGPRYRRTTTVFSPFLMEPLSTAATNSSSESKVRAFPVNPRPSLPVILATAPPGAKLPFKILYWKKRGFERKPSTRSRGKFAPEVTSLFDGFLQRPDYVLFCEGKFAIFVRPAFQILAQSQAGDSHVVAVDQLVLHQISKNL